MAAVVSAAAVALSVVTFWLPCAAACAPSRRSG